MDSLKTFFDLNREELFRRYLIAELFSPGGDLEPVFILSPVKVSEKGERIPTFFADGEYHRLRHLHCIFWNREEKACNIYEIKPFGCTVLLCSKMTEAEPVLLRKQYYYRKWLDFQHILFEIFPQLEHYTSQLRAVSCSGRRGIAEITRGLNQASALM